jgi:soluble lytic murein transglycosylase-like protein
MKRLLFLVCTLMVALPSLDARAQSRAQFESLVASHARANMVPEALVHRVIVRESKYHPDLIGRGGTIGLMQIKLATARGVGYGGDAAGLRDPDTNLAYGIKYLAGAYRAANGDHNRAMRYYASGYYYAAKQQRLERAQPPVLASAPPQELVQPKMAAAKSRTFSNKTSSKSLADAKAQVPRPPTAISGGANGARPR